MKDDGGPAFPRPAYTTYGHPGGAKDHPAVKGMSLRDYFAGQALQGMMANPEKDYYAVDAAREAYAYADAMLAERSKS